MIRTPTASITVRGTIFDVYVQSADTTWLLLIEGAIEVCTENGKCRVHDEPGKLIRITSGEIDKPVKWTGLSGKQDVAFESAFPFIVSPPERGPAADLHARPDRARHLPGAPAATRQSTTTTMTRTASRRATRRRRRSRRTTTTTRARRSAPARTTSRHEAEIIKKGIGIGIGIGIGSGHHKGGGGHSRGNGEHGNYNRFNR